ncbi:S8 family serine peptidase [bacterium]
MKLRLIILLHLVGLAFGSIQASQRNWVFFRDKGDPARLLKTSKLDHEKLNISKRAMIRRAKVMKEFEIIDHHDYPISMNYIRTLEAMGAKIITKSRWLNGVSVLISEERLQDILDLPFVRSVQPVRSLSVPLPQPAGLSKYSPQPKQLHALEYGFSYTQLDQIRVPDVHDLGLTGEGVYIGMIDSGFDTEGYRVFSKTKILSTYDFYWDDENTANEAGDSSTQHNHGTMTLSVVGGFEEGVLIGSAYGASYALAKTEWIPTETRWEEDLWVIALDSLESLGVDIVSTSLGYQNFDDKFAYSYEDLNGDICITTVAADIAAQKGVLILTSAGNEGNNAWRYVNSPADGDSVIAVGAVDWNGNIASFSSIGPTYDGRIKPDVMAMGSGVYSAKPDQDGSIHYVSGSGTSFSCPLVAGVSALVLQAHPELTPMQVRDALRETADKSEIPNNEYGWGLVNAYDAVFYHGPFLSNFRFSNDLMTQDVELKFIIHSDKQIAESSIQFHYKISNEADLLSIPVLSSTSGFKKQYTIALSHMPDLNQFGFYISLTDTEENGYTIPNGAPNILYQFSEDGERRVPVQLSLPESHELFQNRPNPFNMTTRIPFQMSKSGHVEIQIFNILGQKVVSLLNESLIAGDHSINWDGDDEFGNPMSSGLYFYTFKAQGFTKVRKMVLAR